VYFFDALSLCPSTLSRVSDKPNHRLIAEMGAEDLGAMRTLCRSNFSSTERDRKMVDMNVDLHFWTT
jgi:hypothetical protein